MNNREKGNVYEEAAASFLISKKCVILERNYRRKTGEIDLIVWETEKSCLVFVEVKYRKSRRAGVPEEAVNPGKQARIRRTAEWYLKERKIANTVRCRFDVVSIENGSIRWIRNAFGAF